MVLKGLSLLSFSIFSFGSIVSSFVVNINLLANGDFFLLVILFVLFVGLLPALLCLATWVLAQIAVEGKGGIDKSKHIHLCGHQNFPLLTAKQVCYPVACLV